jgi:hypothetical protein
MEATLVVVTLISLAIAIGMAIVTWRMLHDERERADARVALLEEGLAASLAAHPPRTSPEILDLHSAGDPDWLAQFPSSSAAASETAVLDEDPPPARSRKTLALYTAAGIVLAILAIWSVGRLMAPGIGADRVSSSAKSSSAAVTAANAAPLELVALEQTRAGDSLTVHGVVRNPPGGVMIDQLAVVVAFFDASGQQLASVRAPLDFRSLAPGDESPFQVTTTAPAGVTRYRVSFRRDEGTIVPHVDRRQQES